MRKWFRCLALAGLFAISSVGWFRWFVLPNRWGQAWVNNPTEICMLVLMAVFAGYLHWDYVDHRKHLKTSIRG